MIESLREEISNVKSSKSVEETEVKQENYPQQQLSINVLNEVTVQTERTSQLVTQHITTNQVKTLNHEAQS